MQMEENDSEQILIRNILSERGYDIIKMIGKGSQGNCFVVYSEKYQMKFVAKCICLLDDRDNKKLRSFEKEVNMLTHFVHKNIIKVYDYFSQAPYLFMIIEYCENGSLMEAVRYKFTQSDLAQHNNYDYIRRLISDVLSALKYCHDQSISHHDIKPSNIVVDSFGRAKLCDFGISQSVMKNQANEQSSTFSKKEQMGKSNEAAEKQSIGGSLYFMSPQLLQYSLLEIQKYDMCSADIWAFGITLYVILTGHFPFGGRSKEAILDQQINTLSPDYTDMFNPPEKFFKNIPSSIPSDIKEILEKSLMFEESERATASELLDILYKHHNQRFRPCPMIKIDSIKENQDVIGKLLAEPLFLKTSNSLPRKVLHLHSCMHSQASIMKQSRKTILTPSISSTRFIGV